MNKNEDKIKSDEETKELLAEPRESSTKGEVDLCTVDEILEEIGFGKWQVYLLFVLAAGVIANGAEIAILSFLAPCAGAYWDLEDWQVSAIAGSVFFGELLGGLYWGGAADAYGRKKMYAWSLVVQAIFGTATAFSPSFTWLLILRTIVGFGVAGASVPYDMLAEALPAESRNVVLPMVNIFWGIGTCGVVCVAWWTLPTLGWRYMVLFCEVPVIIALLNVLCLDMSPRWLLGQEREPEAREILVKAGKVNGVELHPFRLAPITEEGEEKGFRTQMKLIFGPELLIPSLALITIYPIGSMAYTASIIIGTVIFQATNDQGEAEADLCQFDYPKILIGAIPEILAAFVITLMSQFMGRRPIICIFALASTIMMCVLWSPNDPVPLSVLVAIIRGSNATAFTTLFMATPEIYPTPVRGTTHSVLYALSQLGAICAPFLVFDVSSADCYAALALMTITWAAMIWLVPETAGRDLDTVCGPCCGGIIGRSSRYGDLDPESESLLPTPLPKDEPAFDYGVSPKSQTQETVNVTGVGYGTSS